VRCCDREEENKVVIKLGMSNVTMEGGQDDQGKACQT
jgi:hypothetical protein